jgi:hypothetical protein
MTILDQEDNFDAERGEGRQGTKDSNPPKGQRPGRGNGPLTARQVKAKEQ